MTQKINLEEIQLDNFSEKPTHILENSPGIVIHDYKLFGYFKNEKVGHVTIAIMHSLEDLRKRNDFWFNLSQKPPTIRPFVFYQDTEPAYMGQGVSGRLIILANEISKIKFQQPLSSSTQFVHNHCHNWQEFSYAERPAKRVWEKLERDELAKYCPYNGNPRWTMK